MGFSDTIKELMDQGMVVSKDLAVKAGGKAQDLGSKGMEASKDLASKAGAKIQELGEKGVLMLETKQLEGQVKKLITLLGAEHYRLFEEGNFSADAPEIQKILGQITSIKETMEKKESELKNSGAGR